MIISWAIQRLNGISSPINAAFTTSEVAHQLKDSSASVLFTCRALLSTAEAAAARVGISKERIFLIDLPGDNHSKKPHQTLNTIENIIEIGRRLPGLPELHWTNGQGARQVAFLCYSSGTSGFPVRSMITLQGYADRTQKGVMISHRNVIANILQITANEMSMRSHNGKSRTEISLCALPQSHIYGLVYICQLAVYRGDQVVILPRYDFDNALACVSKYQINTLFLVSGQPSPSLQDTTNAI